MIRTCLLSLIGFSFLISPIAFGQASGDSGSSQQTQKFNSEAKEFNDWYISVFAGGNLLQSSDLNSFGQGEGITPGYDLQLQLTKEITHAVGISLMGQIGKTHQYVKSAYHYGFKSGWEGKTDYWGLSLLGDVNLSQLFRRADNHSPFRWALHVYAGAGFIDYTAKIRSNKTIDQASKYWMPIADGEWNKTADVKFRDKSVYSQIGTGLKYKISRRFDVELRAMYVITGDDTFDGSGRPDPGYEVLADKWDPRSDNFLTLSLGLQFKIGKHDESLQWHPITYGSAVTGAGQVAAGPCADEDNDGVCDIYDKCPGTPEGYIVDGSGCPLDTDKDGVPDTIDECPTIPGPPTNNGCPIPVVEVSIGSISTTLTEAISGIEFDYDKDVIRPVSYPKLDNAFVILQAHPTYKFYVEGHTDAAGSVQYNQNLSERRAAAVVRYLVNKGIPANQLVPVGKGKTDLKWQECDPTTNCPPWKNLENRRVIFKPYGDAIQGLDYNKQ